MIIIFFIGFCQLRPPRNSSDCINIQHKEDNSLGLQLRWSSLVALRGGRISEVFIQEKLSCGHKPIIAVSIEVGKTA